MADTFTSRLRYRLQETGANRDIWGGLLNSDALNLIEKSIAGLIQVTVAGVDVTLTTNNGSEDQSRYAILDLIGAPGAARNIIIPAVSKLYVVRNSTGQTMTITTNTGGNEVDVGNGAATFVMCDGTDVVTISPEFPNQASDSAALGGIPAAQWARLNTSQDFDGGQGNVDVALSMAASVTPSLDDGNVFSGTLTADTTLATPSGLPASAAQWFTIILQQATGTGPWDISFSAFYDFLGDIPTMPQEDGQILMVRGMYLPALGVAVCDYVTESTGTQVDVSLAQNESNVDLFRRAGSPAGVVTINVTIESGVVIHSESPLEPALDLGGGFASGSVINITNLGFVVGRGGKGANGGWVHDSGDTDAAVGYDNAGEAGGNAIRGAGAGVTVNITNASGRIWSGGGGGGAGGVSSNDLGIAVSGGGGGGAGLGEGGRGARGKRRGNVDSVIATNGARGRLGLDGSASGGAAGTGASAGNGSQSASGAGGDYGASGTGGTANTTGTSLQLAETAGGAAGKAVDVNSSTVNFVNGSGSPNVKGAVS